MAARYLRGRLLSAWSSSGSQWWAHEELERGLVAPLDVPPEEFLVGHGSSIKPMEPKKTHRHSPADIALLLIYFPGESFLLHFFWARVSSPVAKKSVVKNKPSSLPIFYPACFCHGATFD